jgi:hypothetical protein
MKKKKKKPNKMAGLVVCISVAVFGNPSRR